jgi:predicted nucleic acid-binding protein
MQKKYLLDTCIWRDFYEARKGAGGKALGKYAAGLFLDLVVRRSEVLVPEIVIWELKKDYPEDKVNNLISIAEELLSIRIVLASAEQTDEAERLSISRGLPFADCLIAVTARDNAAISVSNDRHLLECLADVVKTVLPQDAVRNAS